MSSPHQIHSGGNGSILLVDDDKFLLTSLAQSLAHAGYTVISADSGLEALDLFHLHHTAIGLVLTDVVMPGLFGDQLAIRLLKLKPSLKVILMTGNSIETLNTPFPLVRGRNFLMKPFLRADLLKAVASQIGEPPPPSAPPSHITAFTIDAFQPPQSKRSSCSDPAN